MKSSKLFYFTFFVIFVLEIVYAVNLYGKISSSIRSRKADTTQVTNVSDGSGSRQILPNIYKKNIYSIHNDKLRPGSDTIVFSDSFPDIKWARWDDQLFFVGRPVGMDVGLYSLHIPTGKIATHIVPNVTEDELDFASFMELIHGKIYFGTSKYLGAKNLYVLDNPSATPRLISDMAGAGVTKLNDKTYLFYNGEGDACWGYTQYYTFDFVTEKLTKSANFESGCDDGEYYLGYDNDSNSLLGASFTGAFDEVTVNTIFSRPMDNPDQKTILFSENIMPPGTSRVIYIPTHRLLILRTRDQWYRAGLNDQSFVKINSPLPTKSLREKSQEEEFSQGVVDDLLCFNLRNIKTYTTRILSYAVAEDQILTNNDKCKSVFEPYNYGSQVERAKKLFAKWDLPRDYRLVVTEE